MATSIDADQLAGQLPEVLKRAECAGERFVIEREGHPVAAIVSTNDLQSLPELSLEEREAAWLQDMAARGLITLPTGEPVVPFEQRPLIRISGKPLSETIIEERR